MTRIRRSPTVLYPVRAATRTTSGGERPITVKWARENEIVIANFGPNESACPPPVILAVPCTHARHNGRSALRRSTTGFDRFQAKLTSMGNARNAWNRPQKRFSVVSQYRRHSLGALFAQRRRQRSRGEKT